MKIESLFIETIQNIFVASVKPKDKKITYLDKASDTLDILKFLLQVMWELGKIDNKKFIVLSSRFEEIGRMLGGWQKKTKTQQMDF